MSQMPYDVVILAGGRGRRLGEVDKAEVRIGERSMLRRVLEAATVGTGDGSGSVIVVGPERAGYEGVRWVTEEPAGSGPLAAMAAGAACCTAPVVVVLAVDLPLLTSGTICRLLTHLSGRSGADAAVLVDADGHRQPLVAAYRHEALVAAFERIGDPRDRAVRSILDDLDVAELPAGGDARDVDTPADLKSAEFFDRLGSWTRRLAAELGVEAELADLDLDAVLRLAKEAAHAIDRPAAPLSAFVVGYAAGLAGDDPAAIAGRIEQAAELARSQLDQ